jgi:hypothetical protein
VALAISAVVAPSFRRKSASTIAFFVSAAGLAAGFDFRIAGLFFLVLAVAFAAAFAVFAFFVRFGFEGARSVSVVVVVSVLIVSSSFLAGDPRLTIHHSGAEGKRVERTWVQSESRGLKFLDDASR